MKGNLQQLVLSSDIDRLVGLEGCLSGNVPAQRAREGGRRERAVRAAGEGAHGEGGVRSRHVHQRGGRTDRRTAHGPDQAGRSRGQAGRTGRRRRPRSRAGKAPKKRAKLGKQASSITLARFKEGLATLALQYGLTARPSLDDPSFVSTLVFDSTKPAGTPKQRFAYLFPSREAALVSVRLKAGLSERAADAHDRADPPGGGDAAVAAAARGVLSGDGRAGDRRGSDGVDHALDRAAAGGRAAGDGGVPSA